MQLERKALLTTLTILSLLLLGCSNSAVKSDWDQLSPSAQEQICYGVSEFGAESAAALEYTLNDDYSKDDLADFLRGEC
jgi:uncharacterized membrane protein